MGVHYYRYYFITLVPIRQALPVREGSRLLKSLYEQRALVSAPRVEVQEAGGAKLLQAPLALRCLASPLPPRRRWTAWA
jgi:hypothetical protein